MLPLFFFFTSLLSSSKGRGVNLHPPKLGSFMVEGLGWQWLYVGLGSDYHAGPEKKCLYTEDVDAKCALGMKIRRCLQAESGFQLKKITLSQIETEIALMTSESIGEKELEY